MSTSIKAIETVYNGYRFRSRLEARWAVFFDTMRIRYQYEVEGFDLGISGGWYLPDFWLSELNHWVEIKPSNDFVFDLKCEELARQSKKPVIRLAGDPYPRAYAASYYDLTGCHSGSEPCEFAVDGCDYPLTILWLVDHEDLATYPLSPRCACDRHLVTNRHPLHRAYLAARGARFEHGERGR